MISCSRLTVKPWAASWSSAYAGACTISLVVGGHHVDRADHGGPSASQPLVRGEESEERLAQTLLNFT